jgi:hypothetical protein
MVNSYKTLGKSIVYLTKEQICTVGLTGL